MPRLPVTEPNLALPSPLPPSADTYYAAGVTYHQQGHWHKAIACYQQALALENSHAAAHYNLGVVYDQRGQIHEAIDCYQRAIAHAPDYVKALSNLSCALAKAGQLDQAIRLCEQAIARHPSWATLHNNLGQALLRQGKAAAAIASYRCAIALEPDMVLAYLNLAAVWQQQGHSQSALAAVQQALEREPDHLAALDQCVSLALAVGDTRLAFASLQRLVGQQPQWIRAYCRQMELLPDASAAVTDALTLSQQACRRFLLALQTESVTSTTAAHLVETLTCLGDALRTYGALHQAEVCYRHALLVQPQNADLYQHLGDILRQQRREAAAILIYQAGRSLEPHHIDLALALAQSAAQRQRWDVAADHYRQVVRLQEQGQQPHRAPTAQPDAATDREAPPAVISGIYIYTRDWAAATACPHTYRELDASAPSASHRSTGTCAPIPIDLTQDLHPSPCGGITCLDCSQRMMDWFQPQLVRPGIMDLNAPPPAVFPKAPRFTATITNGRAWVAPQRNHWQVCHSIAILPPDGYLLGDLSRDYPWYLPGCDRYDFSQHHIFTEASLPPVEFLDGSVAVLSGLSGHVYYHWMIDVLPRLEIMQRCGVDLAAVDYIVVNSDRAPFQRESLAALGLTPDQILTSDRHPHLQAKTLVVPSFPGALGWADAEAIAWLRRTFLPLATFDPHLPRRIYIQRTGARHRRVLNKAAVIEAVQRWGFVPVALETLSLREQISLFAQATAIVAPHGAGLTNLVFCQPQTRLLELVSPHYMRPEYPAIAQQLGLIHYQVLGAKLHGRLLRQLMYQSPVAEDLWVNREILQTALELMMGNAANRAP